MNSRSKYKTKQREILPGCFETVPGVHVAAGDVCEFFKLNPVRTVFYGLCGQCVI